MKFMVMKSEGHVASNTSTITSPPHHSSLFHRLMSSNKKNLLRTVFTANGTCGCSKTKASEVHEPTPKPKPKPKAIPNPHHILPKPNLSSMASSTTSLDHVDEEDFTSTTISESETLQDHNNNNNNDYENNNVVLRRSPLVDSVAIEKDSSNPYHDFRHSMLQMIFEKEIESEEDLQDLLQCFLHLNAPCHHHIIVKAFNEICKEAFPHKVSTTSAASQPSPSRNNPLIVPKTR
ncbi:hypothetical protein Fmac_021854 [Flemingia macrophylla]|uniref:Transcription repressor n=1 Tax=Flemingia macrophylla TaxID=520843 RepID=A0ABD1LYB8_9FABA